MGAATLHGGFRGNVPPSVVRRFPRAVREAPTARPWTSAEDADRAAAIRRAFWLATPAAASPAVRPVAGTPTTSAHWTDGGRTSLDNLVLLCRRHHRPSTKADIKWSWDGAMRSGSSGQMDDGSTCHPRWRVASRPGLLQR